MPKWQLPHCKHLLSVGEERAWGCLSLGAPLSRLLGCSLLSPCLLAAAALCGVGHGQMGMLEPFFFFF